MARSRYEQETIILFNEAEYTAEVYAYNSKWKRKLEQLSHEFPSEVKLTSNTPDGSATYKLPKGLLSVRKPMSDEQRARARERALATNLRPPNRN